MIQITQNSDETFTLGKNLATTIHAGDVVTLTGDLGSGKTTFTKGFAEGLGLKRHITSPTFLIVKTYEVSRFDIAKFYHLDLYRLGSEKEIEEIGILDILGDFRGVVVIEWADRMGSLMPRKRIDIQMEYMDEDKRKITIEHKV